MALKLQPVIWAGVGATGKLSRVELRRVQGKFASNEGLKNGEFVDPPRSGHCALTRK